MDHKMDFFFEGSSFVGKKHYFSNLKLRPKKASPIHIMVGLTNVCFVYE